MNKNTPVPAHHTGARRRSASVAAFCGAIATSWLRAVRSSYGQGRAGALAALGEAGRCFSEMVHVFTILRIFAGFYTILSLFPCNSIDFRDIFSRFSKIPIKMLDTVIGHIQTVSGLNSTFLSDFQTILSLFLRFRTDFIHFSQDFQKYL